VYELADGAQASAIIPSLTGDVAATFTVKREGQIITVERQGTAQNWQVLLVNVTTRATVEHGIAMKTSQGLLITPTPDASQLKIQPTVA
jgi:alpha-D-xyloside xylohydrolase